MSKGKRVKGDFDNFDFDQNPDLFDNPELLDAYLDSLGVGKKEPTPVTANTSSGIDFSKLGDFDDYSSEDAGAQIADMLMSNMMGNSIHVEEKKTEKVQVSSKYSSTVSQRPTEKSAVSTLKDASKKLRSNIALVRTPNTTAMRWLSIRDTFGNATAVPVSSDTVTVNPDDLDDYLDSIYVYRKITGMPVAVYSKEDFDERFIRAGIRDVDPSKFIFISEPEMFGDDRILVYTVDGDEKEQFKTYLKESLTTDEIAGSGLMITAIMRDTCCMLTNYSFAEFILNNVMEDSVSKGKLEADILDDNLTNVEPNSGNSSINIDFEKFSSIIENGFMHIAQTTINLDNSDDESTEDEDNDEDFDPYANQATSDETEEGKVEGASDDDGTFQDSDNEHDAAETIRISGEDTASARESDFVTESSTVSSGTVRSDTSDSNTSEKEEAEEPAGVQSERGDRNTSEFKEVKETEEVQEGNGHTEITEVDSETFNFEEEGEEEEDSMVINVTTVGRE